MTMNSEFKAHFMLSFTAVVSALNYSVTKVVMPAFLSPSALLVCRAIVCIFFFKAFHFISVREKVDVKDFLQILFSSVFGVVLNQICFYEGLNLTKPINASLMMATTPIIVFVLSAITATESVTFGKLVGVFLGATGTILLLTSEDSSLGQAFFGDIFMLVNSLSWASYLIIVKPLVKKYHPITILKWNFLIGFIVILPYGASDFLKVQWSTLGVEAWCALFYIMLFASILNYYINSAVMAYVNPASASSYIYLQPILAAFFAVLLGKDHINPTLISSLLLVLAGITMINFSKQQSDMNAAD